jgi:radical SAM superfamily enzyme YgiQ (UPF0313 family)
MYGQPTGLLQVMAAASEAGHDAKTFYPVAHVRCGEFETVSDDALVESILAFKPDLVAMSMMTAQFHYGRHIASKLKERDPDLVIVAGGRHPSFAVDDLDHPFDVYVLGEGETTFRELASALEDAVPLSSVEGIAYRDESGTLRRTGSRKRIRDLDKDSPLVQDSMLLEQAYRGISLPPLSESPKYALIEYSRGCRGTCDFCDNDGIWRYPLHRSPEPVVSHMRSLKEEYGVDLFYVFDLNFTSDERRAYAFCEEIQRQGLRTNWYCMSNIVTAKRPLLEAMRAAGCFKICYGVESASDASLAMMNKKLHGDRQNESLLQIEQAQEVLRISADLGIINNIYYIIGFPWETEDMILQGQALLNQYEAHQLNIGIFTPHFGTVLRQNMLTDGYNLSEDLDHYDRGSLMYDHRHISATQMKALQGTLYSGFYSSPMYARRMDDFLAKFPQLQKSFSDYWDWDGFRARLGE